MTRRRTSGSTGAFHGIPDFASPAPDEKAGPMPPREQSVALSLAEVREMRSRLVAIIEDDLARSSRLTDLLRDLHTLELAAL